MDRLGQGRGGQNFQENSVTGLPEICVFIKRGRVSAKTVHVVNLHKNSVILSLSLVILTSSGWADTIASQVKTDKRNEVRI